jgi:hypothetical protein
MTVSDDVVPTAAGALYQIKGRVWIRAVRVPACGEAMNSGDAYVYNGGTRGIFVWVGSSVVAAKKHKAVELATLLQKEAYATMGGFSGKYKVTTVFEEKTIGGKLHGSSIACKRFWAVMNATPDAVSHVDLGGR